MKSISTFILIFLLNYSCLYCQEPNRELDTVNSELEIYNIPFDNYDSTGNFKKTTKLIFNKKNKATIYLDLFSKNEKSPFDHRYTSKELYSDTISNLKMIDIASFCAPIFCYSEDEPVLWSMERIPNKSKFVFAPDV